MNHSKLNPRNRDKWSYEKVDITRVGLGNIMPKKVVLFTLTHELCWSVHEVEVTLSPQ